MTHHSVAVVYGTAAGVGGLGLQAATAIASLAGGEWDVHAFGPGHHERWPLSLLPGQQARVIWHESPQSIPPWAFKYTWWRWYHGQRQLQKDRLLGRWARKQIEKLEPELCYVFTQVGLETLKWARSAGVRTVLDNPNGHIRHYREVCLRESRRWCDSGYIGHPTEAMVERVEEEYALADRIRVSSEWARTSMTALGVPAAKIEVVPQAIDLMRFQPKSDSNGTDGQLRLCFVGQLGLAKGFVYLARAIKDVGTERASLEIVGATGNRDTRRLLETESTGISLSAAPGDPLPAYHRAELLVLPSLHDGFGFVVAEAMACGLPVIVTEDSGASCLVRNKENGWIVPSGKIEPLAAALEEAISCRPNLAEMGRRARASVEESANPNCFAALREWAL
jgi:glycosyltransferase involved in cell wall biosynthesis